MNNLALWYRRFGEPESVLHAESSAPALRQPGDLRVRMLYSPVNASDLIPVTGRIATGRRYPPSRDMKAWAS